MKKLILIFILSFSFKASAMDEQDFNLFSIEGVRECLIQLAVKARRSNSRIAPSEISIWVTVDDSQHVECIEWPISDRNTSEWRGPIPPNTVANIHSHPSGSERGMSTDDILAAEKLGLPFYAIHSRGNWIYKASPEGGNGRKGKRVVKGTLNDLLANF